MGGLYTLKLSAIMDIVLWTKQLNSFAQQKVTIIILLFDTLYIMQSRNVYFISVTKIMLYAIADLFLAELYI